MSQGGEREALDGALAIAGEDIVLRRVTRDGDTVENTDVTCRARVDTVDADEIVGTIATSDLKIILSPSEIIADLWPDGETAAHPRITDFVICRGKQRQIKMVDSKIINDVWVRINLVVAG